MAGMGIPRGSCTSPGTLALPGLGMLAQTFWQKIRHVLRQVADEMKFGATQWSLCAEFRHLIIQSYSPSLSGI